MGKVGILEVLQSLCSAVQLMFGRNQRVSLNLESGDTYKLGPVRRVLHDIFHDVSMYYPPRHHGKPVLSKTVKNTDQPEDARMG